MTAETNGREIKVSVSYGLKVPINPADTFAGTHDAHISYSITDEAPKGADPAQIAKAAHDLEAALLDGVKLAVFAALDVGYNPETMMPVVTVSAPPAAVTPPRAPQPQAAPRQSGGGGGVGQYAPPKADLKQQPVVLMDYFGNGELVEFYDQRSLKADGTYSPRAADFRSVRKFRKQDGSEDYLPLWITDKQGHPVARTAQLMEGMRVVAGSGAPFQGPDEAPY